MHVQPLFPSFVAIDQIQDRLDNSEIVQYCYDLRAEKDKQQLANGWQSGALDLTAQPLQQLLAIIQENAVRATDMYGLALEPEVAGGWFNLSHSGYGGLHNNPPHLHANYFLSVVYYPLAEPNSGDITLLAPFSAIEYTIPHRYIKDDRNPYNSTRWSITPEPGKLLMFPSWLMHFVNDNRSGSDRISMAFDIKLPVLNRNFEE